MTDFAIRIQKGVPMPVVKPRGRIGTSTPKYPWALMQVGDSFVFPGKDRRTAYSAACNATHYHQPKKFVAREYEGHMRIWRII